MIFDIQYWIYELKRIQSNKNHYIYFRYLTNNYYEPKQP
jgi:hypothetical protein